jgi:hypothetical protein
MNKLLKGGFAVEEMDCSQLEIQQEEMEIHDHGSGIGDCG